MYNQEYLRNLLKEGYDLERRIINAHPIPNVPEVITPLKAVYTKTNIFTGYIMNEAEGMEYDEYNNFYNADKYNLYKYAKDFTKLEDIIKRAHNIVFPDLLSCGNIFYKDGNFSLIDYDGMQIGGLPIPDMSTALGYWDSYKDTKYTDKECFTKEIDIKSLIFLYFDILFNVAIENLNNISKEQLPREINYLLNIIGLDDEELKERINILFDPVKPNEYLGNLIYMIADKYEFNNINGKGGIKTLTKKII